MRPFLLDYHSHREDGGYELLSIRHERKRVEFESFALDPGLSSSSDGSCNEYGGATASFKAADFLELMVQVQLEEYASRQGDAFHLSMTPHSVELTIPGPAVGPEPRASLTAERSALMMLDACDMVDGARAGARTGLQLPKAAVHQAFLKAIRLKPAFVKDISRRGLERAVTALLMESHAGDVRLEKISESQDSWLVHAEDETHAPMLLTLVPAGGSRVGLQIVDRINGVRDRKSAPKAVVVTRSYFSPEVTRQYGGLSERMEFVDYDRLVGMLSDAGWTSRTPGFLTCPVGKRPEHSVFISYSHATASIAVWLHNRLNGWGYDCFLDDVSLMPGEVILSAIRQAIDGADAVLLCCTKEALASSWVAKEIQIARQKEEREGKTLLIPLDLDGSVTGKGAPPALRERLSVDLRDWSPAGDASRALKKIRDAIANAVSGGRAEG